MKRCAFVTAILCVLLFAGCAKNPQTPPGISDQNPIGTDAPTSKTETIAIITENTDELSALRRDISDKNCMLGMGFFGYIDSESDDRAVREYVANSTLAQNRPFLTECIPILADGAELYAFVPQNNEVSITVCPAEMSEDGEYTDRRDAPIYAGKPGEAVVLRCNLSEIHANVLISATDGTEILEFHPTISLENGHAAEVVGCYDFSVYETDAASSALELLLAADEVQDAMKDGMKLLSTGDIQSISGHDCMIFALGTDRDEQFVRERLYAVSDEMIYVYSAVTDSWEALGAG